MSAICGECGGELIGYGADANCPFCDLAALRAQNERLNGKLDKKTLWGDGVRIILGEVSMQLHYRLGHTDKADIERDSGVRRYVDDILGVKKAQAPTPTIKDTDATAEPSATLPLADKCFCGKPVHSYSSTGAPLCEKHTAEAMQE